MSPTDENTEEPQAAPEIDLAARPRRGRPRRIRTDAELNQTIDRGLQAVEAGDRQAEAEVIRDLRDVIETPRPGTVSIGMETNILPTPEEATPQVVEATPEQVEEQVQATTPDPLDAEIERAIAEMLPSTHREIPRPRYGSMRDSMFVMEIDGEPVPLRFNLSIESSLHIESREEYPLVVREELRQIHQQIQKKALELGKHLKMRFMVELKKEMLTQALKKKIRDTLGEVDLARMQGNGQFDRILKTAMDLLQQRSDEAYAQDHPAISDPVPASTPFYDDILLEVPPSMTIEGRPATTADILGHAPAFVARDEAEVPDVAVQETPALVQALDNAQHNTGGTLEATPELQEALDNAPRVEVPDSVSISAQGEDEPSF